MAQDIIGKYQLIVIGGSAGSLDVLIKIISSIPSNTNASIVLIVHRKNNNDSILSDLLSSKTRLPVQEVEDKEPILAGHIYIAPPDYHLLLEDEHTFSLDVSEKIQFSRPSIDVTFESAAEIFGERLIGILLSGANADGANGMKRISMSGGYTIVQNPETSEVGFMPQQAINATKINKVADANEIGKIVKELLSIT